MPEPQSIDVQFYTIPEVAQILRCSPRTVHAMIHTHRLPAKGFHLDAVTLSTPERWDRMLLVFAWAYYWLNAAGWAMETAGKAREWRANTVKAYRTHALWRLGHWGLEHHDLVWRTLLRAVRDFRRHIPPLPIREVTEATSP